MKADCGEMMYRINCLAWELDSIYHQAALKNGHVGQRDVRDVYCISGQRQMFAARYKENTGISKQTLNSALRKLERTA